MNEWMNEYFTTTNTYVLSTPLFQGKIHDTITCFIHMNIPSSLLFCSPTQFLSYHTGDGHRTFFTVSTFCPFIEETLSLKNLGNETGVLIGLRHEFWSDKTTNDVFHPRITALHWTLMLCRRAKQRHSWNSGGRMERHTFNGGGRETETLLPLFKERFLLNILHDKFEWEEIGKDFQKRWGE